MKTCKHIRSQSNKKSFLCKMCRAFFCKSCVKESLSVKVCGYCGQRFYKDDLNATTCTRCKRCPLCKVIITLPDGEEGNSAFVRDRILRRCYGCKSKFGGELQSEATHNNIRKIKGLVSHYRSFENEGGGDSNRSNYWHGKVPPVTAVSEAQAVSELDNCVQFLCDREFDINDLAPLKQRMQTPCRQDELTSQLAPVAVLLLPEYSYHCPRCDCIVT